MTSQISGPCCDPDIKPDQCKSLLMGKSRSATNFRRLWRCLSLKETKSSLVSIINILKIINAHQDSVKHGKNCLRWQNLFLVIIQSAFALMAPIQSLAQLIKSAGPDFGHDRWLAPNDHLRDFESNRRYNWLTRIDQHVKEYFQLCCWHDVSVPARSVVIAASESFERALKESKW